MQPVFVSTPYIESKLRFGKGFLHELKSVFFILLKFKTSVEHNISNFFFSKDIVNSNQVFPYQKIKINFFFQENFFLEFL